MKLKGYLLIISAATLWGLIGPVSRFALGSGMGALETGFFRAVIAWFFFAPHAVLKGKASVRKEDLPLITVFGLIGISAFYSANFITIETGGAAFAAVMLYTAPAWVAFIAPLIFKEKVTIKKVLTVILTISGIIAICFFGNAEGNSSLIFNPTAIISGVLSGLTYSMYYILGKYFSGKYDAYTLFLYILPIGALGLMPFISFSEKAWTDWGVLLFIAFFCTYLANSFYYAGLKRLEPTRAVLTATIEPVVAAFFSWLIWNELFTAAGFTGAVIIIVAVIMTITDTPSEND